METLWSERPWRRGEVLHDRRRPYAACVCVRDAIPGAERMEEKQAGGSCPAIRPDDPWRHVGVERTERLSLGPDARDRRGEEPPECSFMRSRLWRRHSPRAEALPNPPGPQLLLSP